MQLDNLHCFELKFLYKHEINHGNTFAFAFFVLYIAMPIVCVFCLLIDGGGGVLYIGCHA